MRIATIAVEQLAERRRSPGSFFILDVREPEEWDLARLPDPQCVFVPMSLFGSQGTAALPEPCRDQQAEIYVLCHHGVRSAQVAHWLAHQGWTRVHNIAGGIDAYAQRVDPSVGSY